MSAITLGRSEVMGFQGIAHRLREGRPLVVDADTCACFRTRGVELHRPGSLGELLRQRPAAVFAHYQAETASRVDVLCALTADTTPRSLAEVGMQHRSALLTGQSVELAQQAAEESQKPVAVAGVLGSDLVTALASERVEEELDEHALRLEAAGCDLIVARGMGSRFELMAAVRAGRATELPVWAVVESLPDGQLVTGDPLGELMEELQESGVQAILLEAPGVARAAAVLERAGNLAPSTKSCCYGVLVGASEDSVRGFPDSDPQVGEWARDALCLDARGARIIGGGAGTTEAHTAALAEALGALHPSIPAPAAITAE